ncbi:isocitrate lyase/PEP mutase family protein [Alphaproteobacteria bacterium]|jgi:2-methylisocitrate lyase-like PEP mutase family enzyme|nr:isocitrate lyase/PEP mutase family protein [Alphaproteobacteria bacterium]
MSAGGKELRNLLEAPEILIMPGVYDGFSCRVVEQAGFRVGSISGAGISESHLGWADRGIMSLHDNLNACRDMVNCSNLLLMADGDTGYGNAVNVHFTVRAFEQIGLCGLMLEDQVWPKRCGHMKGKDVIAFDEAVGKIRAAANARRSPDFLIKARTDAAGTHGIDEAIRRLNAYAEAGADCLFADALLTADDIAKVAKSVSKPLFVNMGFGIKSRPTTPLIGPEDLQAMGVSAVVYPRLLTSAALRGMMNAMSVFKDEVVSANGTPDRSDLMIGFDDLNQLTGMAFLDNIESQFTS